MLENLDMEALPPQQTLSSQSSSFRLWFKDIYMAIAHDWLFFLSINVCSLFLLEASSWVLFPAQFLVSPFLWYDQLTLLFLSSTLMLLVVYFQAEKRALRKYIQAVCEEQELYERTYIALSISTLPGQYPRTENGDMPTLAQKNLLLIGVPGAGKTIELRTRLYKALQNEQDILLHKSKIPIFIPMNNYNAFLHDLDLQSDSLSTLSIENLSLVRYLSQAGRSKSKLPGLHFIQPFLRRWIDNGQVLFLCDGLNEVSSDHLANLCEELLYLMLHHTNQFIMTCREWDFQNQELLQDLIPLGNVQQDTIQPLSEDQIKAFVQTYVRSGYVDQPGDPWKYTAEQILSLIDKTHFRDECMNPLMLSIFMKIVNTLQLTTDDLTRGQIVAIDTRGKLLQAFIEQLLERQLGDKRWKDFPFQTPVIRLFLCHIAYISRRLNCRNGLPLGKVRTITGGVSQKRTKHERVHRLRELLVDPATQEHSLLDTDRLLSFDFTTVEMEKILAFAEKSTVITIGEDNSLSFYHEMIAEYFAAEYLQRAYESNSYELPFGEDLIKDVEAWKEPIRIWAGLLPDAMSLANRLARLGKQYPAHGYNALTLGLLCLGVKLKAPSERPDLLPDIRALFVEHIRDTAKRHMLAETINRSAYEGGDDVYRAFLPLVVYSSVRAFLLLLDASKIVPLLFSYLKEQIATGAEEALLHAIISALAQFGQEVIPRAILLSQEQSVPAEFLPEKQIQLRQAAIEILGCTQCAEAVTPLITLLGARREISKSAAQAIKDLGPALSLAEVLQYLGAHRGNVRSASIQYELLGILDSFLKFDERRSAPLSAGQYAQVIETMISLLADPSPESIQGYAYALLLQEAQARSSRQRYVIERLVVRLDTEDHQLEQKVKELLAKVGRGATQILLQELRQPHSSKLELMRERIVAVLEVTRDEAAIPDLLYLLDAPATRLRERAAEALYTCRPSCIDPLVRTVLSPERTKDAAVEAAELLKRIGSESVVPICHALSPIIQERTALLIPVLAHIGDVRSLRPLMDLLAVSLADEDLAIILINALGSFADQQAITFLIQLLEQVRGSLYSKITEVLGQFGETALDPLLAALRAGEETLATPGIRNALIHLDMKPFPYERFLQSAIQADHWQAFQLMLIFQARGKNGAPFLVKHLCASQESVRDFVHQTLNQMNKDAIFEALLEALDDSPCRSVIASYLQKYSQDAVSRLVNLLSSEQQGQAAAQTLIDFQETTNVISHLLPGLNSSNERARGLARFILIQLAKKAAEVVPQIILLFRLLDLPNHQQAFESLLQVLTGPLAGLSLAHLLEALETDDPRIQRGSQQALVQLATNSASRQSFEAQKGLIQSLFKPERREAAAATILQIGEPMIDLVNPLITHSDSAVKKTASRIMSNIGPATLPHIYANLQVQDPNLRSATLEAFYNAKTGDIRKRLIDLLTSRSIQEVQIAVVLLLKRLEDELSTHPVSDRQMLPELLQHLQAYQKGDETMRIVTLLMLLPKTYVLPLLHGYLAHASSSSLLWLTPLFLFLGMQGDEARNTLSDVLNSPRVSAELYAQIIGIMGMLKEDELIKHRAVSINQPSQTVGGTTSSAQKTIARHALGGLLLNKSWDDKRLRQLQGKQKEETYEHELYSLLLGESYIPRIQKARDELRRAQEQAKQLEQELAQTHLLLQTRNLELSLANDTKQQLQDLSTKRANKITELEREKAALDSQNNQLAHNIRMLEQQLRTLRQQPPHPYQGYNH